MQSNMKFNIHFKECTTNIKQRETKWKENYTVRVQLSNKNLN